MQLYPYHSPVRFYPTMDSLTDMTNPQNTQFFGKVRNPYPLEIKEYHRFLIPNYENEVDTTDLELWLIGENEYQIACEFGFNSGQNRLLRLSFVCEQYISGHFEIKKTTGETVFFSNCVSFVNSTIDNDGRKNVRFATKCYFNRLGYDYENSDYDWFVTNLPAYDLGLYLIDSEYNTIRVGDMQTLIIQDSFLDEISTIEFISKGDCNVLNFVLSSVLNNELYLNGTKRTIKEKPEIDELLMVGKMKFTYNKDETGRYVQIDEDQIFSDAFKKILGSKDKTMIFIYDNVKSIQVE